MLTPDQAASRFNTLKATKDGRPVVVLMGDPEMEDGFLSLVQRGANGRTIQVVKSEDLGGAGHELTPHSSGGVSEREALGWLARIFAPLLGKATATKAPVQRPVTFEAAIALPELMDNLWTASDGLTTTVRNILLDEELTDKRQAIEDAIAAFNVYLQAKLAVLPTLKAEELSEGAEAVRILTEKRAKTQASKAGRVISAANMGKIRTVLEAIEAALPALRELEAAGAPAKKAHPKSQEDDMQVQIAAQFAAEQAIKVAKSQGITDTAELTRIGTEASTEVFKMAVQGPAQPAIPTNLLDQQRRMAGGESGTMSAPEGMLLSAINRGAGSMAKKADGTPLTTDAEAAEWLAEQVAKAHQNIDALGDATHKALEPVFKALKKPQPSSQGQATPENGEEGKGKEGKEPASKSEGNPFQGSGLDFESI